jgi:hypothetical protein
MTSPKALAWAFRIHPVFVPCTSCRFAEQRDGQNFRRGWLGRVAGRMRDRSLVGYAGDEKAEKNEVEFAWISS